MNFSTKAQTLKNLKKIGFNIPKLNIYRVKDFQKNKNKVIKNIQLNFKEKIAIRSSSTKEDVMGKTNAGKYKSFLNVDPTKTEKVKRSIEEIIKDYNKDNKNEFFIQSMVKNVKISGVCTTRDIHTKLPYTIINYSKGRDTTRVTSGKDNTETINYLENKFFKLDNNSKKIYDTSKKLTKIFNNDSLDIEFAINSSKKLFILQVRAIYLKNKSKLLSIDELNKILSRLKKKISKLKKRQYNLHGNTTFFGVMPDWNPAEIIGIKPKPLALSLYQEIITNHIWSSNRKSIGFKDLSAHHLMTTFFGTPFVDVRIDFNSWLPEKIDKNLSEKLINFYLSKFRQNINLHDKVEFEILFTCFTLSSKKKIKKQLSKKKFTKSEINKILENLKKINLNTINEYKKNKKLINKLILKQNKILNLDIHNFNKIYFLIEDCKTYGTFAFSGIARCAFIGVEMLNSFVEEKIIEPQEKIKFLNSIKTINKEMQHDFHKLIKKQFINKYGHLRPNTYEISSKNYSENFSNYFQKIKKIPERKLKTNFKFNKEQIKKINEKLKKNNLKISAIELIKFIKESIELREYSKFIFTKSIDLIFNNLKEFGKKYKIDVEDLSYLNINTILDLHYNLNVGETIKFLRDEIKQNKKKYILNSKILLPEIIIDEKSLYLNKYSEAKINFITNQKISGNLINYNKNLKYNNFKNKILCIENADPGYDFVFNFDLKGLVTRFGGANSHMAIRCAELNIPALIGVGDKNFKKISNSNFVEIDCELKKYNLI
tara:strand:+ start:58 stop:2367 length:2310 start_codon:yes stop_codon:yes gene_type:complete